MRYTGFFSRIGVFPMIFRHREEAAGLLARTLRSYRGKDPLVLAIPGVGASHLFEEPGALESAAQLAGEWFSRHFIPGSSESL